VTGPGGARTLGPWSGPLRARSEPGAWTIVNGRQGASLQSLAATDTLWIGDEGAFGSARGTAGVRWQNKTWRGRLKLFLSPRGKLTLVTRVPLETYMIGVVPYEIGGLADDLLEAGRAQAIAARSYTLFYKGRRASEGFDLYGTVEDQVYGSIEGERPLATRCVETTRGEIALADERPIRANYSSTCGGISADVWEAWPADPIGYLVSHRDASGGRDFCERSPHYRWKEEWSATEFLSNLATYGPPEGIAVPAQGVGDLRDARVARRSRSGRAWRLQVETTTATFEVPAHALRRVLRRGGNPRQILRSNLIKIAVKRDPRTRQAIAVVVSGAGSGHGVGLCQTGAIGMARSGIAARDIVLHYYPGSSIEKMY
jgi:stage II sporulation protein D